MNKHIWWAVALENSVLAICWTGLAIHFDKWWLALFSLLAFTTIKSKKTED